MSTTANAVALPSVATQRAHAATSPAFFSQRAVGQLVGSIATKGCELWRTLVIKRGGSDAGSSVPST
eukprot:15479311-Alexandrium_andersonii.AAC.1